MLVLFVPFAVGALVPNVKLGFVALLSVTVSIFFVAVPPNEKVGVFSFA